MCIRDRPAQYVLAASYASTLDPTSALVVSAKPKPPPSGLSLIHISEPTRPLYISYAVFCLKKRIRVPPFRLRAAVCCISAHSCPSYTSLVFALFSFFLSQSTTKLTTKHRPKTTYLVFFSNSEAKSRKNAPPAGRLQRSPPGAPPAGPPHQPGGARAVTGPGFAETTSALVGSSVLAYDAASTYL